MQNRSTGPVRREFDPAVLPEDFPVHMGGRHSPSSEPITWLHLHDCLELGYCHEGAGIFMVEDKVLPFAAGDVSVINDREMHRAQSAPETGSSWSFVLLDPARLLPGLVEDREALSAAALCGEGFPNILRGAAHPDVAAAVRDLVAELEARRDGHRPVVRGLVLAIMGLLQRLAPAAADARGAARRDAAEKIAPALDHLSRRYAQPLAMEELAAMCCTSGSNLRRLFRQVTGRAPREYLTYLRVQMAAALLESTRLRVLDVAARVGYPTLSGFNRHFRRVAGRSPRQWRRSPAAGP